MNNTASVSADYRPIMDLLERCPRYQPTSLRLVDNNAFGAGLGPIWIKNEGERMGLGSFKALGGSFAILQLIARAAGKNIEDIDNLDDAALRQAAAGQTFVCATAGNHGLAVAAASKLFGASSVVYVAESVPESFAVRLRDKGAKVVRQGAVYEEAMAGAMAAAEQPDHQLVADTSWDGYTEVPALIYQGYTALAQECREQFSAANAWPNQVFLQAGVGGMAAAVAAHIRHWWPSQPRIIVVEPDNAPCLAESVAAGKMIAVTGDVSIMGRLDCKEPSLLTFNSLRETADAFVTVSDAEGQAASDLVTAAGWPTTPSGAAGIAALLKQPADASVSSLIIVSETAE